MRFLTQPLRYSIQRKTDLLKNIPSSNICWWKTMKISSDSDRTNYHKANKSNRGVPLALYFVVGCGTYFYITSNYSSTWMLRSTKALSDASPSSVVQRLSNIFLNLLVLVPMYEKTAYLSKRQITDPIYTLEEVRKHDSKQNRIWVTYKNGVYDITDFVDNHPGGEIIMMAAGNAIDPFWNLYGVHKQPEILNILESYRIGSISEKEKSENEANIYDPYGSEPKRNPILIINSEKPFNAEPPLPSLIKSFITPSEIFYVRNHLPVPDVDIEDYNLKIDGSNVRETELTLNELKTKFPKVTVTATVQCAGNRRSEMSKVKPVKGLNWGAGAIGNAVWSGVRLIDVLKYCGMKDLTGVHHIQFEGLDTDPENVPYGASITVQKFLNSSDDIILAYEMNGEPLPPDHGFPLRVVVPGVVGARCVKWLGRVTLSKEESPSHWQQNDYKGFSPSVDWDTVNFKSSQAIQELPIISAICQPLNGDRVKLRDGKLIVSGYAWSGGGSKIIRVDLTVNKGESWHVAEIVEQENAPAGRCWSWVLWQAEIPVNKSLTNEIEIWAKAVDSNYNTQPESFINIWNLRGVLANAYHRIKVNIENK